MLETIFLEFARLANRELTGEVTIDDTFVFDVIAIHEITRSG